MEGLIEFDNGWDLDELFEVVVCRELVNANQSVDWELVEVDQLSSGQGLVKMEELIKVDDL